MHIYWLVALIFAITAASIARGKGRSVVSWFVAGLVLGPFGLVVAVLPPAVRDGWYLQCPACQEVIRAGANLCRYCRTPIEVEEPVEHVAATVAKPERSR